MADIATHFPPQTYSSSFFLNSLTDDDQNAVGECNNKESAVGARTENTPLLDCFISTMRHSSSKVILAVLLVTVLSACEALECSKEKRPRTRTFESLLKYEGNKIPFDPPMPGSQGNYVQFSFKSVSVLPQNSFLTFDSIHIHKLSLNDKQIEEVHDGAFVSLFCLHILDLSHNNIRRLSRDVFQELFHLETLDLQDNQLEQLPDLVFSLLGKLRALNLANNQIQTLQTLTFFNLSSLEDLNLKSNQLKDVQSEVLLPLVQLKFFDLESNQLADVELDTWQGVSKLEILNLADNTLFRFEPSHNFSFERLKSLNLSRNDLMELNVIGIREHLPSLQLVDLNDNPWPCEDLAIIVHELADAQINYPGRNYTAFNYRGVACRNVSDGHFTSTAPPPPPQKSANLDDVLDSNNKILASNAHILQILIYVRNLLVVLFIIVVLCIVLLIFEKYDYFRAYWANFRCFKQPTHVDLDDSDVENFRLMAT